MLLTLLARDASLSTLRGHDSPPQVLELKSLVDESMSAFEDLSRQREQARRRSTRRRAGAAGVLTGTLVSPSALLNQHLSLNLLNLNIPAYYMPSYERRYNESNMWGEEGEDDDRLDSD